MKARAWDTFSNQFITFDLPSELAKGNTVDGVFEFPREVTYGALARFLEKDECVSLVQDFVARDFLDYKTEENIKILEKIGSSDLFDPQKCVPIINFLTPLLNQKNQTLQNCFIFETEIFRKYLDLLESTNSCFEISDDMDSLQRSAILQQRILRFLQIDNSEKFPTSHRDFLSCIYVLFDYQNTVEILKGLIGKEPVRIVLCAIRNIVHDIPGVSSYVFDSSTAKAVLFTTEQRLVEIANLCIYRGYSKYEGQFRI